MRNVFTKVAAAASLVFGLQLSAQATLTNAGVISGTYTTTQATTDGAFTDLWDFRTAVDSSSASAATTINLLGYGVTASSIAIYAGAYTDATQLVGRMPISLPAVLTTSTSGSAYITTVSTSAPLTANTDYTLAVSGNSQGIAGYTAIIALATAPVPEPETYAMLATGLGMMSLIARRRKKMH